MNSARTIRRRELRPVEGLPADLHPVLRRIYSARQVGSPEDLDYSLERMLPFATLGGIENAARLLAESVRAGRKIMIIADYDADGATACAVAIRGLRALGAAQVDFLVPDRTKHGYGLSAEVADLAAAAAPDVLITVDNGISSLDGVARARALGMSVVITDHHLPGTVLPAADVIVNPNLVDDAFPSKNLAGVGVMFYVLAALRAELRALGWFEARGMQPPNLASLLDLVALGTVADMVPLDANNRILVSQGLARLRAGRGTPGIAAILAVAKRRQDSLAANDLAFFVGPRLNAAGRMTDMSLGIRCLIEDKPDAALRMATELDALNRQRREIQAQMQEEALQDLPSFDGAGQELPAGLCIYQEHWHHGVVGVLASQIKERVRRPVIAFARESGTLLKGSGRSVDGIHLRDVLANIATGHPGLLQRYGGHAMAAGLTLNEDRLSEFKSLFEKEVLRFSSGIMDAGELLSDGELEEGDLNMRTAELLRRAGPWGQAFPEPLFDGEFDVRKARVVGERHLKLDVGMHGSARPIDAIAFNQAGVVPANYQGRIHLAYRLDVNEYLGRRTLQLVVEQAVPL